MILAAHQPQYLPWPGYFNKILHCDIFVILDDVQYKKNEWQNRNKIKTSDGVKWLTVPVHYKFGQKINEIKIDKKVFWQKDHIKTIFFNYKKSKFFDEVYPLVEKFLNKNYDFLVDVNMESIKMVLEYLDIKKKIVKSSDYNVEGEKTLRLVNLCKIFNAGIYLSGKGAKEYIDEELFKANNIKLVYQNYQPKEYPQLFGDFVPNLSIIDMMFNCGKEKTLSLIS